MKKKATRRSDTQEFPSGPVLAAAAAALGDPEKRNRRRRGAHTTDAAERAGMVEQLRHAEHAIWIVKEKLEELNDEDSIPLASVLHYVVYDLGQLAVDIENGEDLPAVAKDGRP